MRDDRRRDGATVAVWGQMWPWLLGGLVFMGAPWAFAYLSRPYPGGVTTTGTVVHVEGSRRSCQVDVEYAAAGATWRVRSAVGSSSLCDRGGAATEISYPVDRPGQGRVMMPTDWVFIGAFTAFGALSLTVFGREVIDAVRPGRGAGLAAPAGAQTTRERRPTSLPPAYAPGRNGPTPPSEETR